MSRTLYALLVGIDRYPHPIPRLSGCVNDINEFETYLRERAMIDGGGPPRVLALRDGQATRAAVIAGLTTHLAQAGRDDVALFYFCGHGSQEPSPEEFWHLEPDRKDETILCHDSRMPGQWDLADKELGLLVRDLAARAGHVAVILDCCHSGSGTRGELETVRRAPMDYRPRPISAFLPGVLATAGADAPRGLGAGAGAGWYGCERGRHVLVAACRDDQTAKEYDGDGQPRGALSYFLVETLRALGGALTYRDLFARTDSLVRSHVDAQAPQIEVVRAEDLDALFLDGTVQPASPYFLVDCLPGRVMMRAGAAHGVARPTADGTTVLALFPLGASADDLRDLAKSVGQAEVIDVQAATSRLRILNPGGPASAANYKAVVISTPAPRLVVRFEGAAEPVEAARAALNRGGQAGGPSIYVREPARADEPAELRLLASGDRYTVAGPGNDRPLAAPVPAGPAAARLVIRQLEHIARWQTALRLENPTSGLGTDAVELTILRDGRPLTGPDIRLEYEQVGDGWAPPRVQIGLKNKGRKALYCALLGLSEDYEINAGFFPTGSQRLNPGEEVFAHENRAIPLNVPDEVWERGSVQVRDVLKLIVCTEDFDARLIAQAPLAQPGPGEAALRADRRGRITRSGDIRRSTSLDRLLRQVQTRGFVLGAATDLGDWRTTEVTFTTVRPRGTVTLSGSGAAASLAPGVTLESHPALDGARARLVGVSQPSRGPAVPGLPPLLADDPRVSRPFTLVTATTRGDDPGLSVLELDGVTDPASVRPGLPIVLHTGRSLGDGEHLIPLAFDGEFYLPLGRAGRAADGGTRVVLERLPGPHPDDLPGPPSDRRSLGGSIRIYFQMVLSRRVGMEDPYPVLAAVSFGSDGEPLQDGNLARVRGLVAGARRILLYIHGIIGETRTMVPSARLARAEGGDPSASLVGRYDLILTFDYENINTPIGETARALGGRLAAVGLGPGHGKTLHVVAHSMGGLVARQFIERGGGNRVVQHLVMLGTPNAGSPWPRIQDWATTALSLAMNGLTLAAWPSYALSGLLLWIESVDVTLDQMAPGSAFLGDLAANPDPGVPYTLIAGDTSIPPAALRPQPERGGTSVVERLLSRLGPGDSLRKVADQVFRAPNDIAVSVASMSALGGPHAPALKVLPAACDHLSYFSDPAGLEALARALAAADP